jgi:hypothetical protein
VKVPTLATTKVPAQRQRKSPLSIAAFGPGGWGARGLAADGRGFTSFPYSDRHSGTGPQAPRARRNGGRGRLVQSGGRRPHSPRSAARPDSGLRRTGRHRRSWRASCALGSGPPAWGGGGARPSGGRPPSRPAGDRVGQTAAGTRGSASFRHRYATGCTRPPGRRRQRAWSSDRAERWLHLLALWGAAQTRPAARLLHAEGLAIGDDDHRVVQQAIQ